MRSIAVVYSGEIRDNGTPFYVRFALAQIIGHEPDWFTEDPSSPRPITAEHDFRIHVDDGRDDFGVDNIPHPWGYWAVDSHLGPAIRIEKARQADIVWCAQKPFVEVLKREGIKASWLPLACEPLLHVNARELADRENREPTVPDLDLAFVGHIQNPDTIHAPAGRLAFLDTLFRAFPNSWYAYGHFHEDMARVYHRARVGVNHAIRDDLNMRFFELASMRIPQLADQRMVGLDELGFHAWEHYIPYTDNAVERAEFALGTKGDLQDLADRAYWLVRGAHTYKHRLCRMLEDVEAYLSTR